MALVETVTDEHDVHRRLAALGLPFGPALGAEASAKATRLPPRPRRRADLRPAPPDRTRPAGRRRLNPDAGPSSLDDSGDPASSDDAPPSPDDDTSQLQPDAEV
jgi:hypothetical protein